MSNEKKVLKWTREPSRFQACIVNAQGLVVVSCGHDDHKSKKDATVCLSRIQEA